MHDPQPQLPFDEQNTLEEIRRLLETQNELLRSIVDRLGDSMNVPLWSEAPSSAVTGDDPFAEDEDDDDFWDDVYEQEYVEDVPEPPNWFARHYPFE